MSIIIGDIKVSFSFYFSALMSLLFVFSDDIFISASIFFVFIHELSHIIMMVCVKYKIDEISVLPFGVKIIRNQIINTNYTLDIMVYSIGVLTNLFLSFLFYILYLRSLNFLLLTFSIINLSLAIFNLLPISVLDGGQILKIIMINKFGVINGERAFFIISISFSLVLFFLSFCLVFVYKYSITLVITSLYLIYSSLKK